MSTSAPRTPRDFLGQTITVGATVVYPVRHHGEHTFRKGVVLEVTPRVCVRGTGPGRNNKIRTWTLVLDPWRMVVVAPPKEDEATTWLRRQLAELQSNWERKR